MYLVSSNPEAAGNMHFPTAEDNINSCPSGKKGFILYTNNPMVIHSKIVAMSLYGVSPENVSIFKDASDIPDTLCDGDEVVVNSLSDLYSCNSDIVDIMTSIMEKGASLICLEDDSSIIVARETDALQLLRFLKSNRNAIISARQSKGFAACRSEIKEDKHHPGRPYGSVSSAQQLKYDEALRLYRSGCSMQQAAQMAGCNYSSFWYWYRKNYMHKERQIEDEQIV